MYVYIMCMYECVQNVYTHVYLCGTLKKCLDFASFYKTTVYNTQTSILQWPNLPQT